MRGQVPSPEADFSFLLHLRITLQLQRHTLKIE